MKECAGINCKLNCQRAFVLGQIVPTQGNKEDVSTTIRFMETILQEGKCQDPEALNNAIKNLQTRVENFISGEN